ncbi:hypothetical protein EC973_006184 [Apophysomyces ossiformis]|uniref:Uncharacterized protein n=1 Tax=Apophysomyces ossiformis TaxID=679940 RepID=A0A8H7ER68_9FUNG|nr:hypothetical protein EC973_006184 [Apophysomyces ossiformis]
MKLQFILLAAFTFLFAAVSAERYEVILRFMKVRRVYPRAYFTVIEFPSIKKVVHANFWQERNIQALTKAKYGHESRGYIDVDDLSAFDGSFEGVINDDTKELRIQIEGDGQTLTFVGQSATKRQVKNMDVRADVEVPNRDYLFGVQTKASDRFSYQQSHVHRLNVYYEHDFY